MRTQRKKYKPHDHRPREFREGDRVTPIYYGIKSKRAVGTFKFYCPGYLSHAMVRWDGASMDSRVKVENLSLIEGGRAHEDI